MKKSKLTFESIRKLREAFSPLTAKRIHSQLSVIIPSNASVSTYITLNRPEYKSVVPRIVCNDGFYFSVQASRNHFCKPDDDIGPYTHVEVGYLSEACREIRPYKAPTCGPAAESVYYNVPIDIVEDIVKSHGGMMNPQQLELLLPVEDSATQIKVMAAELAFPSSRYLPSDYKKRIIQTLKPMTKGPKENDLFDAMVEAFSNPAYTDSSKDFVCKNKAQVIDEMLHTKENLDRKVKDISAEAKADDSFIDWCPPVGVRRSALMDEHRSTAAMMFGVPYSSVTEEQRKAAAVVNTALLYSVPNHQKDENEN